MSHRTRVAAAAALAILWTSGAGHASVPQFWQTSTQAEFLDGEVENVSISASGRVSLGPAVELVHEAAAPFLWALLETPDGSLWLGSGNDGQVIRIDPDGNIEGIYDAPELEVHALAIASNDSVYVATSPDGQISRVTPDGTVTPIFDPDEQYIWTLATDEAGNLFAGTGESGVIYRIAPDGSSTAFYDTHATHVTSLAFDLDGRLLAGTESPGRVFRIESDARAFVLLESGYEEIRALSVDPGGVIYATAVSGPTSAGAASQRQAPPAPLPRATVSTEITVTAVGAGRPQTSVAASPSPQVSSSTAQRGAVFRIAPDGAWDAVWESAEDAPYDVLFDADDGLLVGTGNAGKVFQVSGDPAEVTLLTRAGGQQVTSLLLSASGDRYFTTANPGKLFRLSADRADDGSYTSVVQDANTIATWGSMRWNVVDAAGDAVQLYSRSGNTSTPDDTWADWSGPYANASGSPITSPKARYLQWKAVFRASAAAASLTSVTAAYLERNVRPQITTLTVHPPGIVFQRPFTGGEIPIAGFDPNESAVNAGADQTAQTAPALGRRVYRKGLQSFGWTARDRNDDRLVYDVLYRGEGESEWTLLKGDVADTIFAWDTSSVPDGTYTVKVIASDARSNAPGTALTGERHSTSFDVDNSPPLITVGKTRDAGDRLVVPFTVHDGQSAVRRVEFSRGGNSWRVVYPQDGIPDSSTESFEVEVAAGVSRIIIRATDSMNNGSTTVAPVGTITAPDNP